jgi:hypothetical protein
MLSIQYAEQLIKINYMTTTRYHHDFWISTIIKISRPETS